MFDSWRPQGLWSARLPCPWGFSGHEHWTGLPFPSPACLRMGVLFSIFMHLPESWMIRSSNTLASDCDIDCGPELGGSSEDPAPLSPENSLSRPQLLGGVRDDQSFCVSGQCLLGLPGLQVQLRAILHDDLHPSASFALDGCTSVPKRLPERLCTKKQELQHPWNGNFPSALHPARLDVVKCITHWSGNL